MTLTPAEVEAVAAKLTRAQRRAVINGERGYNDDNTMDGPGRMMLYRLIERGLFEHSSGIPATNACRPDIAITPLGLAVRAHLKDHPNG